MKKMYRLLAPCFMRAVLSALALTSALASAANGGQDASAVLKQAYVKAKGLFGDGRSSLKVGRFEFVDGPETTPKDATLAALKRERIAHRLIGNFGFTHVGRSFDAVHYVRDNEASNFTFVGGRAVEGVFQLRALEELDVDFWYGAFTKPLRAQRVESEFRLFGLHHHDGRGALPLRRADEALLRRGGPVRVADPSEDHHPQRQGEREEREL